eukprot:3790758-Amphidinium_carterae.1
MSESYPEAFAACVCDKSRVAPSFHPLKPSRGFQVGFKSNSSSALLSSELEWPCWDTSCGSWDCSMATVHRQNGVPRTARVSSL